jgi:hypothetical protein
LSLLNAGQSGFVLNSRFPSTAEWGIELNVGLHGQEITNIICCPREPEKMQAAILSAPSLAKNDRERLKLISRTKSIGVYSRSFPVSRLHNFIRKADFKDSLRKNITWRIPSARFVA